MLYIWIYFYYYLYYYYERREEKRREEKRREEKRREDLLTGRAPQIGMPFDKNCSFDNKNKYINHFVLKKQKEMKNVNTRYLIKKRKKYNQIKNRIRFGNIIYILNYQ